MPSAKKKPEAYEHSERDPYKCRECGLHMPREFWGKRGVPERVVHCSGSRCGWQTRPMVEEHHGRVQYPKCWQCHGTLGCDQCAGASTEVLCCKCAAWGTPEALAEHGPVLNTEPMIAKRGGIVAPTIEQYPTNFQSVYYREASIADNAARDGLLEVPASIGAIVQRAIPRAAMPPITRNDLELEPGSNG